MPLTGFVKDDWNDKNADGLEELIKNPGVVAVGECGLDYFRDLSPREAQKALRRAQELDGARSSGPMGKAAPRLQCSVSQLQRQV